MVQLIFLIKYVISATKMKHGFGLLVGPSKLKSSVCFSLGRRHMLSVKCNQCSNLQRNLQFSSVQSLSRVRLCNPMNCSTPGLPVHHQLPEFTQLTSIESVMPSSHLILCRPLPAPNPSQHQGLFQ